MDLAIIAPVGGANVVVNRNADGSDSVLHESLNITASRSRRTTCDSCRDRKVKCGREQPICSRCQRLCIDCTYPPPEIPSAQLISVLQKMNTRLRKNQILARITSADNLIHYPIVRAESSLPVSNTDSQSGQTPRVTIAHASSTPSISQGEYIRTNSSSGTNNGSYDW